MAVSGVVWVLTVGLIAGLALFDYVFHVRKTHQPTLRDAAFWSGVYIGAAIVFGVGVLVVAGTASGVEYFAGYLINEALSIDNLFVFLVVITSFAVPRLAQQKVLLFGIVFALVARTLFIFIGAALIAVFDWAFYLFGLVLLLTAGHLVKPSETEGRPTDTAVTRLAKRFLGFSDGYDGDRLSTVKNGKRVMTPMLLVMIALGGSDLLFAFDSIPALFGITRNVYLVFTATAFSLLGLRQLYFMIDGLLDRLVYLSYGLAAILALIGVKLMLQALHENNIPFINDGKPVPVAQVSTTVSLSVIVVTLVLTTGVSLLSRRGRAQNAVARVRRRATEYLNCRDELEAAEQEKLFTRLLAEERQIDALPTKHRARIRRQGELMDLLRQAHQTHDAYRPG